MTFFLLPLSLSLSFSRSLSMSVVCNMKTSNPFQEFSIQHQNIDERERERTKESRVKESRAERERERERGVCPLCGFIPTVISEHRESLTTELSSLALKITWLVTIWNTGGV